MMILGSFGILYVVHRMKQRNVAFIRQKQTFTDFLPVKVDNQPSARVYLKEAAFNLGLN